VFRITGALVVEFDDEPQALMSAAQASAVIATIAPRPLRTAGTVLGVGGLMCLRAY